MSLASDTVTEHAAIKLVERGAECLRYTVELRVSGGDVRTAQLTLTGFHVLHGEILSDIARRLPPLPAPGAPMRDEIAASRAIVSMLDAYLACAVQLHRGAGGAPAMLFPFHDLVTLAAGVDTGARSSTSSVFAPSQYAEVASFAPLALAAGADDEAYHRRPSNDSGFGSMPSSRKPSFSGLTESTLESVVEVKAEGLGFAGEVSRRPFHPHANASFASKIKRKLERLATRGTTSDV